MYDNRKLPEKERAEIKRLRIERGYPLHAPPHTSYEKGIFLITAAIFEHKSILCSPSRKSEFELKLVDSFSQNDLKPLAWVILPNHYHVLLSADDFSFVPKIVKDLHGSSSREWNLQDNAVGRKVWFNYSDRKIRGDRHFFATINYIHYNPIKHGYVDSEIDWPWSSIHLYLQDRGQEWVMKTKKEYPILDFGRKWDEEVAYASNVSITL
jgi:putative transposase